MDGSVLWYLLRHPGALGVTFLHPAALLALSGAVVFFVARRTMDTRALRLRVAAFVTLVAVLAGLRLTAQLPTDELTLAAVVDVSESVDAAGRRWEMDYVNRVARTLAPGDRMAVVAFAGDATVTRAPGPPSPLEELTTPATGTATDIARAIDTAMALFPAEGKRQLLLLSDGAETRGDSRGLIARVREASVQIDIAVPPAPAAPDISVDKLLVAPVVSEGSVFPVRLIAHNTGEPRPAVLNLFLSGLLVDSTALELRPGTNTIEFPYRLNGRGAHRLRAQLEAFDEERRGNDYREVPILVTGPPRILLVTPRNRSVTARVLERKQLQVDVRRPQDLPRKLEDLLAYQAVLLEDVTADQLSREALALLDPYVREFAGGVILAGGGRTFGDARLQKTALRRLLPVTLEARRPGRRSREPLALFILIDRSNSMGYSSRIRTLRDGEKLRYAKEAALAVVRQLSDQDLLGMIAFDSQAHEIAALRPLRQIRKDLEKDVPRLVESGGTDFFDALASARAQLAASRVARRHIILLTDGDTNRAASDHYPLIDDVSRSEISVTTIRIGGDDVNLRLLRDISNKTGGEFYHVEDVELLPDLMLRDTTRALAPARGKEEFFPELGQRNQIFQDIPPATVPPLRGYAYARPKRDADVLLHVNRIDRRDPILTVWPYGLGRVAALTASPSEDADGWLGWLEFGKFWSQLVRWCARPANPWDYGLAARKRDGSAHLTVRTFGPLADGALLHARFFTDPGSAEEIDLAPVAPRIFSGRLPNVPGGRYPVTIVRRDPDGGVDERTQLLTVPDEDEEPQEEYSRHGFNRALLAQLSGATGGRLNPAPDDVVRREPGRRTHRSSLDFLLIPMALLLFLGDVAVRRSRR